MARGSRQPSSRGLVVDFGGVLTSSVGDSFKAFCEREGIDHEVLKNLVRSAYGVGTDPDSLVSMIETGRIEQGEFESRMGALLSEGLDHPIETEGLLSRMLAELHFDIPMVEAVRDVRQAGVPTALLSNSWGVEYYPRDLLGELFDQVVISGEVGLRKPDRAVFLLVAERLGLPPHRCVFVDDTKGNVEAAEAVGMRGLVHERAEETIPELGRILGIRLEVRVAGSIASIGESP
jgi:epoxide hydrolase-like predicted phosphatase